MQPELLRQMDVEKSRDPTTNAFMNFAALSTKDKLALVQRFNDFEAGRAHPNKLELSIHPMNEATIAI